MSTTTDLPALLANLRVEIAASTDRLLARWSALVQLEAAVSPLQQDSDELHAAGQWTRLATRIDEDHQLANKVLGQLHWACRVDAGQEGTPSLVTENLHAAICHAASLAVSLEAARHTFTATMPTSPRTRTEAVSMARRFLSAAQHDLSQLLETVEVAGDLVPAPPARWHLRAVI